MEADILEKGAIIQRDKRTFAVAPHIPGGFISPDEFTKVVDTAEKYQATALKRIKERY
jgi:NAD(P)H-nitrite reductase large subunit